MAAAPDQVGGDTSSVFALWRPSRKAIHTIAERIACQKRRAACVVFGRQLDSISVSP